MFHKVLIANRGEIAVRIIHACRDLDIIPVVAYSESDRTSLHVRLADEAYLLGPNAESYQDIGRLIDAAKESHSEAIHPGYGLLSENPEFAEACTNAGIAWIGPSAESLRLLSHKDSVQDLLHKHGVPLAPSTFHPLTKENKVIQPRCIGIQVLADRHGNAIHLGERERLRQQSDRIFLAESPSPYLNDTLRCDLGDMAVRIVKIAKYENAGTVDFILDANNNFYFLGIEASIATDHALTETVTGLDVICEQLRIASGEPLSLRQDQVQVQGWVLESHIYAQESASSPHTIQGLQEPNGPGIRLDSGIYPGWAVPAGADPLLAKLIAFGTDRMQAIARMRRAIQEYAIAGIQTNLSQFLDILSSKEFLDGNIYDGLWEKAASRDEKTDAPASLFNAHALAAAIAYADARETSLLPEGKKSESPWKLSGRPGLL